ncbi:MAG TPA: Pecanex-like protein 1 [Actinoplanes sp.]
MPSWLTGRRRILAAVATLAVFGGIVAVTQVSSASTTKTQKKALSACDNIATPPKTKLSTKTKPGTYTTNGGPNGAKITQHADDGAGDVPSVDTLRQRCRDWVMTNVGGGKNNSAGNNGGGASSAPAADPSASAADPSASASAGNGGNNGGGNNGGGNATTQPTAAPTDSGAATSPPPGAGLGVLTNSCSTSTLAPHTGFQDGDRCVSTEFGEVGVAANNPSLLITDSPKSVQVNTPFTLKVSTRNLIRDRFLAAGAGGYYVESSVLANGIERGHFHTACRMLSNTSEAPDPSPVPAFFVATEDKKGGATPDVVTIQVPGLPTTGTAQCASWAGDGSHRIPMMQRANQLPAFDSTRITVRN